MELIRINDRKLKIMLTPSDMTHFEMNAQRLGEDTEQMRKSFRMLMKEVRRKIDFELDDRRVSVQYFPSREGGCEMFVSCSLKEDKKRALAILPESLLPIKQQEKNDQYSREIVYKIPGMEDLLGVCNRLQRGNFKGKSFAYRDERNGYYLHLIFQTKSPFSLPEEIAFLSEYGIACNVAQTKIYISEHAKLVSEKAVEELSALA